MAQKQAPTMFKRGELDFKTILYKQVDRILEKLSNNNYSEFADGVEGLYLSLSYYFDQEFQEKDHKLLSALKEKIESIRVNPRIYPDMKDQRIGEEVVKTAKVRYANLMLLFGEYRLLLERRRLWDERKSKQSSRSEPTRDELGRIAKVGLAEKQDKNTTSEDEVRRSVSEVDTA